MDKQTFEDIYQNKLTPSQKEVIPFLLQGLSYKEISEKLGLVNDLKGNVITHRVSAIRKKMDASDKKDLIYLFNCHLPELVSEKAKKEAGITENETIKEISYPESSEVLDSPFYIKREKIDDRCQRLLDKPGCLLKIKAPKQMGKTSLINRLVDYAEQADNYIVYYDFSILDVETLSDLKSFFYSLASYIADEMSDLTGQDFCLSSWNSENSLTTECTKLLKGILKKLDKPLVLIFDEVDIIFEYEPVYKSLAPMLRTWHGRARTNQAWKKLKLVLGHSTEEYVKLDINQSPFGNVGESFKLGDLTLTDVQDLANKHGIEDRVVANSLADLVGGHPYLIRLALYYLAKKELTLEQLLQEAVTDSGIYREHLQRHLSTLQQNKALYSAFNKVLKSNESIVIKEQDLKHKLQGLGLISVKQNSANIRYKLYHQYFNKYLA